MLSAVATCAVLCVLRVLLLLALIANKSKEISRLNSVYVNLLKGAGVDYFEGKGSLVDKKTVKVSRG